MPPRWLTLAIVAFWLAVAGLFVATDVWPRLAPAEPLMFPVDVVDEAGQQQQQEVVNYNVSKNGTPKYRAVVEWRYFPEDDSFASECTFEWLWDDPEAPREQGPTWLPQVHQVVMKVDKPPGGGSRYRLTRGGEMKRIEVSTRYFLALGGNEVEVKAEVTGEPRAGQFTPHVKLTFPGLEQPGETGGKLGPLRLRDFERDAAAVPVLTRGTVLNPLHPPRRFPDLDDGQRWRFTFLDPLALLGLVAPLDDARGGALREAGIDAGAVASVLDARVLPGVQRLNWDAAKDVPCRVIQCDGDGPVGPVTFWVRHSDGVVMREDFRLWGDSWSLVRLPFNYKMRSTQGRRKAP